MINKFTGHKAIFILKFTSYYFYVYIIKPALKSATIKFCLIFITLICLNQSLFAQEKRGNNLKNLGTNINSVYEEMNPILNPEGKVLYFCRGRHPENLGGGKDNGDVWFSVKDEFGNWRKAQNIGPPINNIHKNDLAGISADGNTLYLNYGYGKNGKSFNPGISFSKKATNGWTVPEKLDIPYFYNGSEHQSVFVSNNENIIIFSIESYGTYGAEDLYVSFKQPSGSWTEPMNLGSDLNTAHQEMTPFLAKDNKTLFFVSNGRKGVGSKDIYKTQRLDSTWKKWSEPENLGPQVNTEGMEMYYFQDNDALFAYIVSTQNSDGYGDLHQLRIREEDLPDEEVDDNIFPNKFMANEEFQDDMFQEPDTVIVFKLDQEINSEIIEEEEKEQGTESDIIVKTIYGRVLNGVNNSGILASITLENDIEVRKIATDYKNGHFTFNLNGHGKYNVIISAKGFMTKNELIELSEMDSSKEYNFRLTPLEIGTTFQLHDVLFEQGTAKILENSYLELDKVASMMLDNPTLHIELAGHTDNQGISKLNMKLSQERVENVKRYLVQKGVEALRISGKGYGGVKPIASNKNEETRKLNRRVEFTILKN